VAGAHFSMGLGDDLGTDTGQRRAALAAAVAAVVGRCRLTLSNPYRNRQELSTRN